jgi:hypothetical protein
MTYKVTFTTPYNFSIKSSTTPQIISMPQNLNELSDVEISGTNDKYVLMYDAASGKWKDINPDEVLNAAASTETIQPGLVGYTTAFIDNMSSSLDNSIDLDAGSF